MPELLALPGVGPKMAIIQLNVAEGQCVGISVDTHVHRICNQLGWTGDEPTKLPEKTREAIQSWMPKDIWRDVNLVLVGLGQEVQTEKQKLLGKCLGCSDPERALALVERLGLDVEREKKRAAGILSAGPSPLKLKE
jgi:endonuclease-3